MNRKETVERIKIMQAFVDGKQIQYKDDDGRWKDVKDPMWSSINEYRIKPEPKYRPFKNAEECWQEMLRYQPFGWIKAFSNKCFYSISEVRDVGCVFSNDDLLSFETIFKFDTFTDGTPFGVKYE